MTSEEPRSPPTDFQPHQERATSPLRPLQFVRGTGTDNVKKVDRGISGKLLKSQHNTQQQKYNNLRRSYNLTLKALKQVKARLNDKMSAVLLSGSAS